MNTKFWRKEGGKELADIHAASGVLMFRHFLEGIVRCGLARYPHESGLEGSMRRLFKENIVPRLGDDLASVCAYAHLVDTQIQAVSKEFRPMLSRVFKEMAVGEGAYTSPYDEKHVQDAGRKRRRGLGGQHRRVHVKARLDLTTRVKDLLQFFDRLGLLQPVPVESTTVESAPNAPLFPDYDHERGTYSLGGTANVNALRSMFGVESSRPGTTQSNNRASPQPAGELAASADLGFMGNLLELAEADVPAANPGEADASNQQANPEENRPRPETLGSPVCGEPAGAAAGNGGVLPRTEATTEEVLRCDFRITVFDALRLVVEVMSSRSAANLRWVVPGDSTDDLVALLDYAETELTTAEFERVLLRVVDFKSELDTELCERLPLHRRYEGFLRHVLVPGLETGIVYAPPAALVAAAADSAPAAAECAGDAAAEGSVAPLEEPPAADAEPPPADDDAGDEPAPPAKEPELDFWRGIEDEDFEAEVAMSVRVWPDGFESQVAEW